MVNIIVKIIVLFFSLLRFTGLTGLHDSRYMSFCQKKHNLSIKQAKTLKIMVHWVLLVAVYTKVHVTMTKTCYNYVILLLSKDQYVFLFFYGRNKVFKVYLGITLSVRLFIFLVIQTSPKRMNQYWLHVVAVYMYDYVRMCNWRKIFPGPKKYQGR